MLHGKSGEEAAAQTASSADPMNISAPFHPTPDCDRFAHWLGCWCGLVTITVAGGVAAERQLSDGSGHRAVAGRPDPETWASSVATPLELQFGEIPGLTQMTSASALAIPDHPCSSN